VIEDTVAQAATAPRYGNSLKRHTSIRRCCRRNLPRGNYRVSPGGGALSLVKSLDQLERTQ